MELFKRNLSFFLFCIGAVLTAIALIVLTFFEAQKLAQAKARVDSADGQMKAMMFANPSPTNKNVKAARSNLESLQARLESTYQELQKGAYFETNDDGVRVISSILRYISDYKKQVNNHTDSNSLSAPIKVPNQFAFGFEEYFQSTRIPEGEIVPFLDKQRQILSYILDKLIDAGPSSIQAVKRQGFHNSDGSKGFKIDPAISARVPDAIDTIAFQVIFTGYTPTLRKFLNSLAYFQLPVVVRSVEVSRVSSKSKGRLKKIFSREFETKNSGDKTPVISEVESLFMVTLEFIEVIKPADSKVETF